MEIILEVIVYLFFEILFQTLLLPFISFIGATVRWLVNLGKTPYKVVKNKTHNATLGVVVLVIIIGLILLFQFKLF